MGRRTIPDAEDAALGAALHRQDACDALVEQLASGDFTSERNRRLYDAIARKRKRGESVDVVTVATDLRRAGDGHGPTPLDVEELAASVPVPQSFQTYINAVLVESRRRHFADYGLRLANAALNGDDLAELKHLMGELAAFQAPSLGTEIQLEPLDWPSLLKTGIPSPRFLDDEKLLPEASVVLGVGPADSGKSLFFTWHGARLSHLGIPCALFSEENGLDEDLRRLGLLRARPELRLFKGQGLDLAIADHVEEVRRVIKGCALVVFDTQSSLWSGDEGGNPDIARLYRDVYTRLARDTGATVCVVDHMGNPQPMGLRRGVNAPRGASTKGQKADVVLEFRSSGVDEFTIVPGKMRPGGRKPPLVHCRVVDTEAGLELQLSQTDAVDTVDLAEMRQKALDLVADQPGTFNKTTLAKQFGARKAFALVVVRGLIAEGLVGPDRRGAKLSRTGGGDGAELWRE